MIGLTYLLKLNDVNHFMFSYSMPKRKAGFKLQTKTNKQSERDSSSSSSFYSFIQK
jgi:hypothetical protein